MPDPEDLPDEVLKLPRDTPYKIYGVSQSMFSIARYYGGCKYNGSHYVYDPETDTLTRDDVLAVLNKVAKGKKKTGRRKGS